MRPEKPEGARTPTPRFIVLDPNGEYANTFRDMSKVRVYAVESGEGVEQLQFLSGFGTVPSGARSSSERTCATPLLRRALREMRSSSDVAEDTVFILRRKVSSILITLKAQVRNGETYEGWKFGPKLPIFIEDLEAFAQEFSVHRESLEFLSAQVQSLLSRPQQTYRKQNGQTGYNDFPATAVEGVIAHFQGFLSSIGGAVYQEGPNEDAPLKFDGAQFADHLEALANQETNAQFFDFLIMRIRTMLSDSRVKRIVTGNTETSLAEWLENYIGDSQASGGSVTVIDLSLVPAEVVHIITAVIARMTLEALQRYRKLQHGEDLAHRAGDGRGAHLHQALPRRRGEPRTRPPSAARCSRNPAKGASSGWVWCCPRSAPASCRPRCCPSATATYCTASATTATKSWCKNWYQTTCAGCCAFAHPSHPDTPFCLAGHRATCTGADKCTARAAPSKSDDPDF